MQKPKLTRQQVAWARKCDRLHRKFSRKNTAHILGIGAHALEKYIRGKSVALEDWEARRARAKNLRGDVSRCSRGARGPSVLSNYP